MDLNRVIPRIDVHYCTVGVRKISCRAEEYACHMHQLAHGDIDKESADEEQVDIEDRTDPLGHCGTKSDQPHSEFFNTYNVGLKEIPH
jgi:hypothetical protein